MNRFFEGIVNVIKHRRLRTHILEVFLFLIACACALIIWFTYYKNSAAILDIADRIMKRMSSNIISETECFTSKIERVADVTSWFLEQHPDMNEASPAVEGFMLKSIQSFPDFFGLFIGWPDGGFTAAYKLSGKNAAYYDGPGQIPPGTDFGLQVINRFVSPPVKSWTFKDQNLQTIGTETIPLGGYDPRIRSWYKGAAESKRVFWTDFYYYWSDVDKGHKGRRGISIAKAARNAKGEIIAVVGGDIPLNELSLFLIEQKVGEFGASFLVESETGKILLPELARINPKAHVSQELISLAYRLSIEKKDPVFVFSDQDGTSYIAAVKPLQLSSITNWSIITIDTLEDFLSVLIKTQRQVVLISLGILLVVSLLVVIFSRKISRPIVLLAKETDKITHLDLTSEVRIDSNIKEIHLLDTTVASLRKAIRSFSRYLPKDVVKRLIEKNQDILIGGEEKEITILFSDIRDFTHLVEVLPIDVFMPLLTEYFDLLSRIILRDNGTIDKYIGDSIMAFWGAPQELRDHARLACIAALHCSKALKTLNAKRQNVKAPEFFTRFGIHTGKVIVGNIGTEERMNYTAIGDSVNIAARLQEVNKIYQTEILISEPVYQQIGKQFLVRPLDVVEVKGRKEKMKIYELVAAIEGDPEILASQEEIVRIGAFTKAYDLFAQGSFEKARELFQAYHTKYPSDFAAKIYLERLEKKNG